MALFVEQYGGYDFYGGNGIEQEDPGKCSGSPDRTGRTGQDKTGQARLGKAKIG